MDYENLNPKPVHIPRDNYPEIAYPEVHETYSEERRDSVHILDYWHVLLARRWTVIATFLTILTVTAIATFKQVPIYQSEATIQIDRENSNVLSFKDVYQIESATDDTLQTQYKILNSRSLARRVIEELDLEDEEEFKASNSFSLRSYLSSLVSVLSPAVPVSEPDRMSGLIDGYEARLTVAPVRQARLVVVSFESKDPKLATRVINAHARHYIEQNFQFKVDATQDAERFLQTQVGTLKSTVENAEDKLQSYSRAKQILVTDQGQNTAIEQLSRLQEEYNKTQADLVQKRSYYELIEEGSSDVLPQLMTSALVSDLSSKLADQEKEESKLAASYGAEWPDRKRIRGQIDSLKSRLQDEKDRLIRTVTAEYTASTKRERAFFGALEAQRSLVEVLNQDFIQYNILKREADSNKQIYDALLQRQKEASVSASLRASNIRIVDPGEVPDRPVKPRKALNLSVGALFGLMLGVGLAFFREYLDNSLKSPDDVSRYLHLATLGTIPKFQSLTDRSSYGYGYGYGAKTPITVPDGEKIPLEFISHASPSSLMAEAYRSMRTSLLLSSADHPPKRILVTSAVPSEGKTVTAINTAISLTQTGSRVVLIDADMRKPRVHSVFAFGNVTGLSSFLTGSAELKDVILESPIPNLFVLPCGVIPPNPGELILSARFNQLLQVLSQYFDYVVIDSPPVANVSDARVLASSADAVILVVKAFATSRHLAQRAANLLKQSRTRNVGVILNDLDVQARTGYYSSYSGRYYYPSNYGTPPQPPAANS